MGCSKKMICGRRIHRFTVSLMVCMVLVSSQSRLYNAEGRKLAQIADNSETVNEEKAILRAQIGSRPPRCERRCVSCAHCDAIQVPTNPQTSNGIKNASAAVFAAAAYVRGDDTSNYKPMSWKCKCGSLIFNP
ncbi:EPIDERMAL PATTERNING FACTOR-like protein 2 [Primulina huaijiensis]|uniref:EPIDERMAL PATTERNING FACTOR-like protein 2 n=1 Tax=Primulina huaijiensis TaxID=1492673 RepID=UPI003CC76A50